MGDQVDYGDVIVEMKTSGGGSSSELSIDIHAERRGIMKEHLLHEGEFAHVGDVVSYVQVERMSNEEVKKDIEEVISKVDLREKKKVDSRDLIIALIVLVVFFFDDVLKFIAQLFE